MTCFGNTVFFGKVKCMEEWMFDWENSHRANSHIILILLVIFPNFLA